MAPLVETLVAREQELADPIERVVFAAPVSERLVLQRVDEPCRRSGWRPGPHERDRPPWWRGRGAAKCQSGSSRPGQWRRLGPSPTRPALGSSTIGAGQGRRCLAPGRSSSCDRDRPGPSRRWSGVPWWPRRRWSRRCRARWNFFTRRGSGPAACRGEPRRPSPSTSTHQAHGRPRRPAARARQPGGWLLVPPAR